MATSSTSAAEPDLSQAFFRFYAELNDFLPPEKRGCTFPYTFLVSGSVKDMIQALGIPHTEVELILVDGRSVDFDYQVQDGDRISVYPVFESFDVAPLVRVRPEPLRETRFVLDTHLGKLATYLRLFGFDSLYRNDYEDAELARISDEEGRILLTKDHHLLKRNRVQHGYYVRAIDAREQLIEVLTRFHLFRSAKPFTRCLRCNGLLQPVPKEDVCDRLPPRTKQYYDEFRRCETCGRIYWKGSHYRRMRKFVEEVLAEDGAGVDGE
ncbi:MAG: Mut7-C RNAse domain-containing protein [Chloroflexota bacterium]|nr:Mut7-C RNAse domain-containing protein [Chloroflexota bacterium]